MSQWISSYGWQYWGPILASTPPATTASLPQITGSGKVIACIEDQDLIDRILTHLREKKQETPSPPLLATHRGC